MNKTLIDALSSFLFPVDYITSSATTKPYFTFNYLNDQGDDYADDEPQYVRYTIQIHLFCDFQFDHLSLAKQVREKLFESGFSYPSIPTTIYEEENKLFHIVFECEYIKAREV